MLWFKLAASAGRLQGEDPILKVSINNDTCVIFTSFVGKGSLANSK